MQTIYYEDYMEYLEAVGYNSPLQLFLTMATGRFVLIVGYNHQNMEE